MLYTEPVSEGTSVHLGEAVANVMGLIQHDTPPVHSGERAVDHIVALGAAQGTPLTHRIPRMVYLISSLMMVYQCAKSVQTLVNYNGMVVYLLQTYAQGQGHSQSKITMLLRGWVMSWTPDYAQECRCEPTGQLTFHLPKEPAALGASP